MAEHSPLAKSERDEALSALERVLPQISKAYRECYLTQGRGALLFHAHSAIVGCIPTAHDYRSRKDLLEIFDDIDSIANLTALVDEYDPRREGILVLMTSVNNETSFLTAKLKSPVKHA
jgi:hypothetical protein